MLPTEPIHILFFCRKVLLWKQCLDCVALQWNRAALGTNDERFGDSEDDITDITMKTGIFGYRAPKHPWL